MMRARTKSIKPVLTRTKPLANRPKFWIWHKQQGGTQSSRSEYKF